VDELISELDQPENMRADYFDEAQHNKLIESEKARALKRRSTFGHKEIVSKVVKE